MRQSHKNISSTTNALHSVNFHDFMEKELNATTSLELASEFGLSIRDVKKLKKLIGRS